MSETYDAIIIGGGIMGCSTALQLARRGMIVALLEKDVIGSGPTGKSSAIIRQHYSNEVTARMALYGLRVSQDFENHFGDECGFTQTGFVTLVPAKYKAGLEANIVLQRRVCIQTELLSAESFDWHPILDELPAGSGSYFFSGFSGHGFKLGPAVGLMMADLVTDDQQSKFDPLLFRFGRFAENDQVRGQYEYSIVG